MPALPKPSRLSLGARFSVRVDGGTGSCGVYLTRGDADLVAAHYRGKVVEVNENGISLGSI